MARVRRILFLAVFSGTALSLIQGQGSVSDPPPENLVEWKLSHFTPQELADGTSDDAVSVDDEGVPNLLRYALGYGPRDPIPTLVSIKPTGELLQITFHPPLNRPDIQCHLEDSTDLEAWNPVETELSPQSSRQQASGLAQTTVTHASGGRFFRISVDRLTEDADEDDLNDDRELAWFASIAHGPADDPDQDGLSTVDELAVGRSPHRGVLSDPQAAQAATGLTILTPLE